MKRTTIVEIISVLFVILFLYTGISKLMEYNVFKEQLAVSPFLAPVAGLVAPMIPITEFLLVLLLIVPRWRLKGLYASTGLMLIFILYIVILLNFSKYPVCSCGGIIEALTIKQHIVFNTVFVALGLIGIIMEKKIRKAADEKWRLVGKQTSHIQHCPLDPG